MADQNKPSVFPNLGGGSLFGASGASSGGGLFGSGGAIGAQPGGAQVPPSGFFGQPNTNIGGGGPSMFGQAQPVAGAPSGMFGQASASPSGQSLFGSSNIKPGQSPASTSLFGGASGQQPAGQFPTGTTAQSLAQPQSQQPAPTSSISGGFAGFGTAAQAKPQSIASSTLAAPGFPQSSGLSAFSGFGQPAQGAPSLISGISAPQASGFGLSQPSTGAQPSMFGGAGGSTPQSTSVFNTGQLGQSSPINSQGAPGQSLFPAQDTTSKTAAAGSTSTNANPLPSASSNMFGGGSTNLAAGGPSFGFGTSTSALASSGFQLSSSPKPQAAPAQGGQPVSLISSGPSLFGSQPTGPQSTGAFGFGVQKTDADAQQQQQVKQPIKMGLQEGQDQSKPQDQKSSQPAPSSTFAPKADAPKSTFAPPSNQAQPSSSLLSAQSQSQPAVGLSQQSTQAQGAPISGGLISSLSKKEEVKSGFGQVQTGPNLDFSNIQQSPQKKQEEEKKQSTNPSSFGQHQPQVEQKQSQVKAVGDKPHLQQIQDQQQHQQQVSQGAQIQPTVLGQPVQDASQNPKLSAPNTKSEELLDTAINKWRHQVATNEKIFSDNVNALNQYEQSLMGSIEEIKKLEQVSISITQNYKENHRTLNDISSEQSSIINELAVIEKELDSLINYNGGSNSTFNQFLNDANSIQRLPSRQEVFKKAIDLEQSVDTLSRDLNDIQNTLNRCQNLDQSKVSTYDYYKGSIGGHGAENQQVKEIDKTLNIFYDTLKWIENTAVDLKFQVEEVEERIGKSRVEARLY